MQNAACASSDIATYGTLRTSNVKTNGAPEPRGEVPFQKVDWTHGRHCESKGVPNRTEMSARASHSMRVDVQTSDRERRLIEQRAGAEKDGDATMRAIGVAH